ncbi:peptidoglycan DD-metalloendopeptidase family protein [Pelagibius litoralis]|uniref:Peptidoglycan DD-metalloendopeptidase family protein n=1 Tax=Pelagibius litoralis TaxID=374515 RepID=A0A967C485_9PROT|nr:peptidoglycan DD-metalloendopeptidase family protein [Pelagibius litoralis]NIA68289.1 peptidoglycan DD-metalloendopeptidase family protein [Pelagibius litoralis]
MRPPPPPAVGLCRNRPLLAGLSLIGLAAALLWPAPAPAQQTESDLQALERTLQEDRAKAEALTNAARELTAEVEGLREKAIATAARAQSLESEIGAAEQNLAALDREETEKTDRLAKRRNQLALTLGALQRLALQPPEAALTRAEQPIDSARAAMLLRVAVPELEARAKVLREELGDLAILRARIAIKRDDLSAARGALGSERDRLSALVARKANLQARTESERLATEERIARMAREAGDLRELMERLEVEAAEQRRLAEQQRLAEEKRLAEQERLAEARAAAQQRQAAEESERLAAAAKQAAEEAKAAEKAQQTARLAPPRSLRPFPEAAASLSMPMRGEIVRLYGQEDPSAGETSKGIIIRGRPGAQIIAPFDGRIAYAGQFRGYGQILIIDHGERYHTILAGLDRIDAVVGQWVLAGEPVAQMSDLAGRNPELYLELRRTGQAVNPLPWLATNDDKVRG